MLPHLVCVGGEDHALRIPFLLALAERGYRITAISTTAGAAFLDAGIAHRHFSFNRFGVGGAEIDAISSFRRLLGELEANIIQSFDTKPNLFVPLAVRGKVPVVRTINGMGWVFSSRDVKALAYRPVYCALQKLASRWTSVTIFQNRDDMSYFDRFHLLGTRPRRVIGSSGIDTAAFAEAQARSPSPEQLRETFRIGSKKIVMFVGRITREKGIPTLLKAASLLVSKDRDVKFLLVGPRGSEGPFAVDPDEIGRHWPHVVALGPRKDVPALLRIANVFAFPTEYREGIPRVLLEAGLSGLPIVATRMPGCSDVVSDSWNGYLVPPRDQVALAARIGDLLADPAHAKAMGARSAAMIRRKFELSIVVESYDEVYRSVLNSAASMPMHWRSRIARNAEGDIHGIGA